MDQTAASVIGVLKPVLSCLVSICASCFNEVQKLNLAVQPGLHSQMSEEELRAAFEALSEKAKDQVYFWQWLVALEDGVPAEGPNWGRDHLWEDRPRLARALHRSGALGRPGLAAVACRRFTREQSRYYDLSDRSHRNPSTGRVGYVNGMGTSLQQAGDDARRFSDCFVDGNNLHCVYLPTSQDRPVGDAAGFARDVWRHLAVEGGLTTPAGLLLAQRWVDCLDAQPSHCFLQCCHSEGSAHCAAALRLLRRHRPELLSRLRVLGLCCAHLILPEDYGGGLQAMNFLKLEDKTILPFATHAAKVHTNRHIQVLPHTTGDDPHNLFSSDYCAAKPFIQEFMRSGNLVS